MKLPLTILTTLIWIFSPVLLAQTPITNGARTTATLVLNTTNSYTFSATNGEAIQIRMGAPFRPLISLYAPSGVLLGQGSGNGSSSLDALLQLTAATNGAFRIAVSSFYGTGTGAYQLNLAKTPGEYITSPGDEGGTLTNAFGVSGVIERGDMDMWSFEANAGDTLLLRMGAPGFRPYFQLYGPRGALLATGAGSGSSDNDAYVSVRATNSGTFTVVTHSYYFNNTGSYSLHLVKAPSAIIVAPGDEGGPLTNGAANSGTLTLGDMDAWSFTANSGENIFLRMGAPGYRPLLHLYGPNGLLITTGAGNTSADNDSSIVARTTNSGTFTVVAQGFTLNATGAYSLTFARTIGSSVVSPGDDGGTLGNGIATPGTNALGDIDLWNFNANAGDTIALRVGAPGFRPSLNLYNPSGEPAGAAGGVSADRDASLFLTATNSGTFTVVLQAFYPDGVGSYTINLARMPGAISTASGDDGGTLVGGVSQDGIITLGDLDLWRFPVCRGEIITLRCLKLSGSVFTPRIRLFERTGAVLATATHATNAVLHFTPTNSGIFTALIDGADLNHAGSYRLTGDGIADGLSLCVPFISGPNAILGGVGGTPGATFIVFTHTNVITPVPQWSPVLTNQFDSFGVFSHTNSFNRSEPRRFYILRQQ